jgi:hypothetical protein
MGQFRERGVINLDGFDWLVLLHLYLSSRVAARQPLAALERAAIR